MLRMSRVDAQIGINTINTKLYIRQPKPEIYMHTEMPRLEMHTEHVKVLIDQSRCFSEAGLKGMDELCYERAQIAKQAVIEATARIVDEGNMAAAVENGGNPIADIAFNNSFHIYDFNIDTIPKSRPKFDFVGGYVDIKVHEGYVEYKVIPKKAEIDVDHGNVEIYMKQWPKLNIEYVGNNADVKV